MLVLCFSSFALACDVEVLGKVEAGVCVTNDYNEGKFEVDEEINYIYTFLATSAPDKNISIGYKNSEEEIIICDTFLVANGEEYYSTCSVFINTTGKYTVMFYIDDEEYYIESFEVVDKSPELFHIMLIIIGTLIILISGIYFKEIIFIALGSLISLIGIILLLLTYTYLLGVTLVAGLIGFISCLFFIIVYISIMK